MIQRLPFLVVVSLFCVMWSSAFAIGKAGLAYAPPLLLLSLRLGGAGLLMVGLAWATGALRGVTRGDLLRLMVLGLCNNALYLGFSYSGMQSVSAGLTSVIIGTMPVATALAAALLLRERLSLRKGVGLALGLGGLIVVVRGRLDLGMVDAAGLAYTFGALAMLTMGTIAYKRMTIQAGPFAAVALQVFLPSLPLTGVAVMVEDPAAIRWTGDLWWSLAVMIVGSSCLGYMAWFEVLRRTSAARAAAWHFLMPPLGLGFGWLLLGEMPVLVDLLGGLPIVVGIWLVTRAPAPRAEARVTSPVAAKT